jgi:hypothetical protein
MRGMEAALGSVESKYVFNYPIHSAVAQWQAEFDGKVLGQGHIGAVERMGRPPYTLVDISVAQTRGVVQPFLQFTNAANIYYEDMIGIPMPRRAVLGGLQVLLKGH